MSKFLKSIQKNKQEPSQEEISRLNIKDLTIEKLREEGESLDSFTTKRPSKALIALILFGVLVIGLIGFILYRMSGVSKVVSSTKEQITGIQISIESQKEEIKNLNEKINKLSGLNNDYQSLENKIIKDSADLNTKFAQFNEKVDSKLQATSVNSAHLQTLIIELRADYLKVEQELSKWREKQKE